MADVRVKKKYVVKPVEPTFTGLVTLSELDQVAGATYVPLVYFYQPEAQEWLSDSQSQSETQIMKTLKQSLARVLVEYYPLAGRLERGEGGKLRLNCNAEGAVLVEAESSSALSDFGDFWNTEQFKDLIPAVDREKALDELPLLLVQVTYFRCGGVSLGMVMSHGVADGSSAFNFITDWARVARGELLDARPFHDRTILRAGEPAGEVSGYEQRSAEEISSLIKQHRSSEGPKAAEMAVLPLTATQVDELKAAANIDVESGRRGYSRYEVLAAHIWRCACKARGYEDTELKALGIAIDARYRLPAFPIKYFGNTAFVVAAKENVGNLLSRPLGFTCERIRKTIAGVTEEYVWSDIEFLKRLDDFSVCQELRALRSTDGPYVNPDPGVISWLSMPIYGLDFGWGSEVHLSPGTHNHDGVSLILPAREKGSVIVVVALAVEHIGEFKKHFYGDIV